MATIPGISVRDIAAFGQNLANLVRTTTNPLDLDLRIIDSTTGPLHELQGLIQVDDPTALGHPTCKLSQRGLQEVKTLAAKCDLLYKTIMLLLQKAADRDEISEESPSAANLKDEVLKGPVPDPSSLDSIGILRKLYRRDENREWVGLRIGRCEAQLEWVGMSLLVLLNMIKLAGIQTRHEVLLLSPRVISD
ncbi:hypothetical protein VMCG_05958 [Cytospora schulzeri]|uniref:Uncharacterized protein n=1 Tax=Cytospora schulzeri TaxID=448051 RepID=A0A423WD20_9PEZI|nr:hypothetical protein VMCG_05958 [Valsa malicola]